MSLRLVLSIALATSSACNLYAGDDACDNGAPRTPRLLNPATLACEVHDEIDGCAFEPSQLSWGACESACTALDEATCWQSAGCRATYDHDCFFGGSCTRATPFLGCVATDLNIDNSTGCAGLDAWSCSRHEFCVATYRPGTGCDGLDNDGDGAIDEGDECLRAYARCVAEPVPGA